MKIVITFILFATGIGLLVGISLSKNSDLVMENYYEKELKYQDRINTVKRTNELSEKVKIDTASTEKGVSVVIEFPSQFLNNKIEGKINFYRADDKKKDFVTDINATANKQEIPAAGMEKGKWKVLLNWKTVNVEYYSESDIFIK